MIQAEAIGLKKKTMSTEIRRNKMAPIVVLHTTLSLSEEGCSHPIETLQVMDFLFESRNGPEVLISPKLRSEISDKPIFDLGEFSEPVVSRLEPSQDPSDQGVAVRSSYFSGSGF